MSANEQLLQVGDPIRPILGRAVKLTLIAAITFTGFAYFAKAVPSLYVHEPWQNDPYDTFVSFAIFFVPLLAAVSFVRFPLFKKCQALPIQRVGDLLRGCRLILGIAVVTLIADWFSVALRVDRAAWDRTTGLAIVLLLITTGVVGCAAYGVTRVPLKHLRFELGPIPVDGLGDAMLVSQQLASSLGPAKVAVGSLLSWVDTRVVRKIRSHPMITAIIVSVLFGVAVAAAQGIGEGIQKWPLLLFFFGVATCAMFAFIVMGGRFLGVIRSDRPIGGSRRRTVDSLVSAATVVPICVAFRSSVGGLIGTPTGSLTSIGALVIGVAVGTFVLALVFETLVGSHGRG